MKSIKVRIVIFSIMLSLFLFGCAPNQTPSASNTISITDQVGNTITIPQPVERVISTYGPATSFIYAVGAEDRLVSASYLGARDPFGASIMEKIDPRFPDILGEEFFTQDDFNLEQAATLNPDLIVASSRSVWLESAQQLDIPIFLVNAETEETLKEAMLLTGEIFGSRSKNQAETWVDYYDGIISRVRMATEDLSLDERVRVLFTGTEPLRVASGDMYQTSIIEAAGGISVSDELSGYWNNINLEQVVLWNPDVIIVPPYGGATVEAITESPEWQILEAVQAGRVYRMPKLVVPWDTPAPDSVLGIVWMAEILNPELVDLDCAAEADYFYNTFYQYQLTEEELNTICSFSAE
jgi:iron complex transport system substrate-binding protein